MKLRPYQQECLDAIISEARQSVVRQIIVMATGTGKCLAKGTPVLMFNGQVKKVEAIVVGDTLMGPDSTPRNVQVLGRGKSKMFDVIPVKGDRYRVNEEHILSLKLSRSGFQYPCQESKFINISIKDYLKKSKSFKHVAKGYRVGVEFEKREVFLDPYFLGVWLGDGTSRRASITTADKEIVRVIEETAEDYGLFVRKQIQKNNKSSVYYLTTGIRPGRGLHTNPILNILRKLNLINNKHVPLMYKANDKETRIQLLSGYLDADGSLDNKGYDYISKSKILAEDIAYVARSLGLACYVKECVKTCQDGGGGKYYRGHISGDTNMLKCKLLRKQAGVRRQKKSVLSTGIKVVEKGVENYYGFQIDGDGLFLLGDFTVTHNTIIFGHLPSKVREKGKKTLILAHREELLNQTEEKLLMIDSSLKIGVEQAEKALTLEEIKDLDVILASVPTIGRKDSERIKKFNPEDYGLIIVDECHRAVSNTFLNVFRYFDVLKGEVKKPNGRILLGCTATPTRADKVGLDKVFDKIVYNYGLRRAIDEGYLCDIKAYDVKTQADLSNISTRMGDFAEGELAEEVNTETRNRLVVESYREIADNTKALAFAVNVEHAYDLCGVFRKYGYISEVIVGETEKNKRRRLLQEYKDDKIDVLVNVGVFVEGVDIPSIETILMARPTKSSVLFSQAVGRGSRLYEGKEYMNLIDFVDNTGKNSVMGLPTLFGMSKNLRSKGRRITEVVDKAEKILEVNPSYDVETIEDWSDENIDKIVKRVDIFAQAELPPIVKQNSKYAWHKYLEEYRIQFPKEDCIKETISIKPNMLNRFEVIVESYTEIEPTYQNGWKKWRKEGKEKIGMHNAIFDAFKEGDKWISQNKHNFKTMMNQSAQWRSEDPTEKQLSLLKKLNVPIPKGITKGQCSTLIGNYLSKKN